MSALAAVNARFRRNWRVLRVIAAALAALGLLSVAIFVGEAPLWAQEAESAGTGISLGDLSDYPTHLTVDGFVVELSNLTATEEYQVTVTSDSARVGIGGCGTSSQKATVTGVAARELRFLVYACAVGEATVTAEVRRTGASSPEASVSRRLMVEAVPANAIGARGERVPAPAAGAVPKVGTPGSVPSTYFDQKTSTSVRAKWGTPSDGGPPLTGFGLLFWRDGLDHPGYANPLVLGPSERSHTYSDLEPDTTYRFQIHACNGSDSCGYWTVPIVEVTTARRPKKPHSISVDEKEARSARVNWSPDADTGGLDAELTGFGVLWRVQGTSWQYDHAVDVDDDARRYTMPGLMPNTYYEVIIQACNGGDSCSAWTEALEFRTPETIDPPEQIVTPPPGLGGTPPSAPISAECPATPQTATVGEPRHLDVTPLPQRKALLCWTPVTGATEYIVQATHQPTELNAAWQKIATITGSPLDSKHPIDLDSFYILPGAKKGGLAEHKAYGLRVIASANLLSAPSDMLIIIDTPITAANGSSPGDAENTGVADLLWTSLDRILGTDYEDGTYMFRYRRSAANHAVVGWRPGSYDIDETTPTTSTSTHKLRLLTREALYAIQLKYQKDDKRVQAARDVYVWPSASPPNDGDRVASFPLTRRLTNKTYAYHICDGTFFPHNELQPADSRRTKWIGLINHAAEHWQAATDSLITVRNVNQPCAGYADVLTRIDEHIDQFTSINPNLSNQFIYDRIRAFLDTLRGLGVISSLELADEMRHEILMYNDLGTPLSIALRVGAFREIADDIGHVEDCWFTQANVYEPASMCSFGGDIVIRRGAYDRDASNNRSADDPLLVPEHSARFNKCLNDADLEDNNSYSDVLHEVGHELGVGGGRETDTDAKKWQSRGHPEVRDSVMNYDFQAPPINMSMPFEEVDCSPHPFDLMAIYALYQTE